MTRKDSLPMGIPATRARPRKSLLAYLYAKRYLYLMLIPCVVYFIIFNYVPMYGITIAFKDFNFRAGILGSPWIGFENFAYMFGLSDFYSVLFNSIYMSFLRIVFTFPIPILLALLLNDVTQPRYQKTIQTLIYMPHFISWVVIGGILVNFLSPTNGVVNNIIKSMGGEPIFFLAEERFFRPIIVLTSIWKDSGWGTIVYLAAITGIPAELYEAATIDGANKFQKLLYITLPCIKSTIVILLILQLGKIMSNGFEQIFILQNNKNLSVSEVFETYTYRLGMLGGRYSFATTVGLFTSVVGLIFLVSGNKIASLLGEDGIW